MVNRILLQTTLLATDIDDWNISRFSMLREYLANIKDAEGKNLYEVIARDREPDDNGDDPILSQLDIKDFGQLWLFALDVGGGLSKKDCAGIVKFHRQGGGILTTRDHQDMGISMCSLEEIAGFHYFHSRQQDPDSSRHCPDDCHTSTINWPNYHSGNNGDYQVITPVEPIHELLKNPDSPDSVISYLPAHPHEGGVGVPKENTHARVIATGQSKVTGRSFNIAVASDYFPGADGQIRGRVVAESTFHHFVDYNWDISKGCPSFVAESSGTGMIHEPKALSDSLAYVKNLSRWLAPKS